ncbi:MAG: malate synthase A [Oligoflexales bacterium]
MVLKLLNKDPHQLLTDEVCTFLHHLHNTFEQKRLMILKKREDRQNLWDKGVFPEISSQWKGSWQVASTPKDLENRNVEITGPVDRKMMIHALNSGAEVFMADLEDATSPRWDNIIDGHKNLCLAVRQELDFDVGNKSYKLAKKTATLIVRPRGWHLTEEHVKIDNTSISASLFDFGVYFFHNARKSLEKKSGPYFYLPKLESAEEARLWNDIFQYAQNYCSIPYGSVRATVLIETLPAALEMEGILHELRDHASGFNAGRWDYIFSFIKRQHKHKEKILPDRQQVSMTAPFMKAYTDLLVKTCHQHGAHAIGGMSAFIPNRKQPQVTAHALEQIRKDKEREADNGFDGTWVAHPDLVSVAKKIFATKMQGAPHQKQIKRDDVQMSAQDLLNPHIDGSSITEQGLRQNIRISLQYINHWIQGAGAVALDNLMEDAATAEISRSQLWQWCHHKATLNDGRQINTSLYKQLCQDEAKNLTLQQESFDLLNSLVLDESFEEFLTIPASRHLHQSQRVNHLS